MSPIHMHTRLACGSQPRSEEFNDTVLPHLADAHRLARWLVGNDHDAEDVVQEAVLRAFRYFRTFSGHNGRGWFLTIVRNTCHAWHSSTRHSATEVFDEELHSGARSTLDPEALALHADAVVRLEHALENLPERFRELLVLREMKGLSYRELAEVLRIPVGTVMSGLSRARQGLRRALVTSKKARTVHGSS